MAATLRMQSAEGILAADELGNALIAVGLVVPADARKGFSTGCLFIHVDGGAATALYCNEGTSASCDFDAVSVA